MATCSSFLRIVPILFLGLAAASGCATGGDAFGDESDDDDDSAEGGGGAGGSVNPSACGTDCSAIDAPTCKQAVCNEETGQCQVVDAGEGTECEDGLFCTTNDSCVAGACTGGPQNDCGMGLEQCTVVTCNEAEKTCTPQGAANGAPCVSDDLCTVNPKCQNGLCVGSPKDCLFAPTPNDCWESTCNSESGACEPHPVAASAGLACEDPNDLCMVGMTCDGDGNCGGGAPKDCSALTKGCDEGKCDSSFGTCYADTAADGMPCAAASNDCNSGTCSAGACLGTPVNSGGSCDIGLSCFAAGSCDAAGQCLGAAPSVSLFLYEDFSDATGWTLGTEWQIGETIEGGGINFGNPDPALDHTFDNDNGIAGVVIGGDYNDAAIHDFYWLTSPVVDASTATTLHLSFYSWLNSDYSPFVIHRVEVFDGTAWQLVWEQPDDGEFIEDASWLPRHYDISSFKNANLQVRWGHSVGGGAFDFSGWNLDDVVIASDVCN